MISHAMAGAAARSSATSSPREIERYLAKVPADARATLEKVRASVRAAAPDAVEAISYGAPAFKLNGRPLAGYTAAKDHCSFFVFSPLVLEAHAKELAAYKRTKGMVHFRIGKPLPATVINRLVKARRAELQKGTTY